ncbi:MAG: YfiT family bacillithiol transferase [Bacteroidota bacterium]
MDPSLSFPIGPQPNTPQLTATERAELIHRIAACPAQLRAAASGLDDSQLDTPYRPGGWTVRQVVHHVADSHINAYIRTKLALTEDSPIIKPYEEKGWAEIPEAHAGPISVSLDLLDMLHHRWIATLQSLMEPDWNRTWIHPDIGTLNLHQLLGIYAWHGAHHVAHITRLRDRMGW